MFYSPQLSSETASCFHPSPFPPAFAAKPTPSLRRTLKPRRLNRCGATDSRSDCQCKLERNFKKVATRTVCWVWSCFDGLVALRSCANDLWVLARRHQALTADGQLALCQDGRWTSHPATSDLQPSGKKVVEPAQWSSSLQMLPLK